MCAKYINGRLVIGSNMSQLVNADGTAVLFSYDTPVAAKVNGRFYRTAKSWSNTTTNHINKWGLKYAYVVPQPFFDALGRGENGAELVEAYELPVN